MSISDKVKAVIRDVQDFPKPGIVFKDITPIFNDPLLVAEMVEALAFMVRPLKPDIIAAIEARGFIFGGMLADHLKCKFVPVRKAGKLPYTSIKEHYELEYGSATIEMHDDAIPVGARVLIHDDLLATGGTAAAAGNLVKKAGGEIAGYAFLINLSFLAGAENLRRHFRVNPYYLVEY